MSRNRRHRSITQQAPSTVTIPEPAEVSAVSIRSSAATGASGYGRAFASLRSALAALDVHEDPNAAIVVHIGNPQGWKPVPGKRNIGLCWWPFSRLPDAYLRPLYGIDVLCVPSTWCADGVQMPRPDQRVEVVPLGVDMETFAPVERERGETLRFMLFDSTAGDYRSGVDLALRAFADAFPGRNDVALDIYSSRPANINKQDARVQIYGSVGDDASLARLYRKYDVLIFSSRGEGAALVALEAMASALPVIHSGQTAMADFADIGQLVGSRKVRVPQPIHPLAETFEPWLDLLTDRLRQLDVQYEKWQAKAHADAAVARESWNWERSARRLLDVLGGRDVSAKSADVSVGSELSGAA